MHTLQPGQTLTVREIDELIQQYAAGAKQAERDYRLVLDGKVRFTDGAAYRRVALLQVLRVVAEERLPPGSRPRRLYDRCPDCASVVFDVVPVTVGEIRRCGNHECGTEWRLYPRHRDAATYQRMAARR